MLTLLRLPAGLKMCGGAFGPCTASPASLSEGGAVSKTRTSLKPLRTMHQVQWQAVSTCRYSSTFTVLVRTSAKSLVRRNDTICMVYFSIRRTARRTIDISALLGRPRKVHQGSQQPTRTAHRVIVRGSAGCEAFSIRRGSADVSTALAAMSAMQRAARMSAQAEVRTSVPGSFMILI